MGFQLFSAGPAGTKSFISSVRKLEMLSVRNTFPASTTATLTATRWHPPPTGLAVAGQVPPSPPSSQTREGSGPSPSSKARE